MMRGRSALFTAVLVLGCTVFFAAGPTWAADPDQPHPHQGILVPYEPGPFHIELNDKQREKLATGKIVHMTIRKEDKAGTGIGVVDIATSPDIVWSRIMSFDHYAEWIKPVKFCSIYAQSGDTTRTHTQVKGFLYKYEYFLINVFWPEYDLLLWTMDYDRKSDFDDCVGAWFVERHPSKEGWSRAWFSNDLKLNSPIAGFLMNSIKKKGIKDAVSWVKRESEKENDRQNAAEIDP